MTEFDKYSIQKDKLQGICDKNNLVFSIRNHGYPFLLTIKPAGGMDGVQTMIEGMDNAEGGTGYINPNASLVFAFRDGDLTYKISETFTISDKLFNKIKGLFKKMHEMWMQHFYRNMHENYAADCAGSCDTPSSAQEADETAPEDEYAGDEFDEFLDEAVPSCDCEDTEE